MLAFAGEGRASDAIVAAAAGGIVLNDAEVRAILQPSGGMDGLRRRLAGLAGGERVFLVLADIHAAAQPGVVYDVYFGLPPGPLSGRQPVGTLNFFAAAPPGGSITRSYDVTGTIQSMLARGWSADRLAVTLAAGGGQSAAAMALPTVGRLSLVVK